MTVRDPETISFGNNTVCTNSNTIAIGNASRTICPHPDPSAVDRLAALAEPDGPAAARVDYWDRWHGPIE